MHSRILQSDFLRIGYSNDHWKRSNMTKHSSTVSLHSTLCLVACLFIAVSGCRDPEFEETPWKIDGFDPGNPAAGPAPLCPAGSTSSINNSLSPYMGGEEYPGLVIEVFSYFRCQNCGILAHQMHEMWARREDYRKNVRVYYHHFPLYEYDTVMGLHAATIAAQRQSEAAFWQMHDYLFDAIQGSPPVMVTEEDLYAYARDTLKLDMAQYDQTIQADETMQTILWDKEQGVELGMIGTPGIFMCGKMLTGWKQNLEHNIDEVLEANL